MSTSSCGLGYPGVRCARCGATNLRAPAKPTVEVDHTGQVNCSMCGHKSIVIAYRRAAATASPAAASAR